MNDLRQQNRRVFCIGIGSSPHESLVREVASATGGKCAFIGDHRSSITSDTVKEFTDALSHEQMQIEEIRWPRPTAWETKTPLIVHHRTIAHGFAFIDTPIDEITDSFVEIIGADRDKDGSNKGRFAEDVPIIPIRSAASAAIVTSAAAARLLSIDSKRARKEFALQYQLLTDETSFIQELRREDGSKAVTDGITPVAQMMPKGSHGFGASVDSMAHYSNAVQMFSMAKSTHQTQRRRRVLPPRTSGYGRPFPPHRSPANFVKVWEKCLARSEYNLRKFDKPELLELRSTLSSPLLFFVEQCIDEFKISEHEIFSFILMRVLRTFEGRLREFVSCNSYKEMCKGTYCNEGRFPEPVLILLRKGLASMTLTNWRFMHPSGGRSK